MARPAAERDVRVFRTVRVVVEEPLGPEDVGCVADVASYLDCAKSTASTHLRKAEAALVDAYLGG